VPLPTLIRNRFQVKPATFLIPIDLFLILFGGLMLPSRCPFRIGQTQPYAWVKHLILIKAENNRRNKTKPRNEALLLLHLKERTQTN
jgi:hypothetical protein